MTPTNPGCCACRFWCSVPDQDGHQLGRCRRFPPSYDGWAMTEAKDWCGEFQTDLDAVTR